MERYDLQEKTDKADWFKYLLLRASYDSGHTTVSFPVSDPYVMYVELRINGKELSINNFNDILVDWKEQIEERVRRECDNGTNANSVDGNKSKRLQSNLGEVHDVLSRIENNLQNLHRFHD